MTDIDEKLKEIEAGLVDYADGGIPWSDFIDKHIATTTIREWLDHTAALKARAEKAERERDELAASFDARVQEMSENFRAVNIGRAIEMFPDQFEQAAALSAAQAEVGRLKEALEPFARVAEYDIGDSEAETDTYRPMDARYAVAGVIKVGDLRRAARALAGKE